MPTMRPIQTGGQPQEYEVADPNTMDNRVECERCGRRFNPDRIDAHEKICSKVKFSVAKPGEKDERDEVEKLKERVQKGFDPMRYKDMLSDGAQQSKPAQRNSGGSNYGATQKPSL